MHYPHDNLPDSIHPSRKIILIVEDDTSIGDFLVQAITQETPFFALHVTDSTRALQLITQLKVDLFLLDYRLSSINGIELFNLLRTQPGLESIPAIILTASLEEHREEIEQHHLIGLDKPVELDDLLLSIHQYLG